MKVGRQLSELDATPIPDEIRRYPTFAVAKHGEDLGPRRLHFCFAQLAALVLGFNVQAGQVPLE